VNCNCVDVCENHKHITHLFLQIIIMTAVGNTDLSIVNEQQKNTNSSEPGHGQGEEEDSDDESEILEESPCGRWVKRREQVNNSIKYFKSFN